MLALPSQSRLIQHTAWLFLPALPDSTLLRNTDAFKPPWVMNMQSRSLINTALLALLMSLSACPPAIAAPGANWPVPACTQVSGAPSVTATPNEGKTLARTDGAMEPVSYTFGLVPLDSPGTMLATVGAQVIRSTDAGCSWAPLVDLTRATRGELLLLTPARGGGAYAWAVNGTHVTAIRGSQARTVSVPGGSIMGLAVDRADARHLRYGDSAGTIWESTDAGRRWSPIGSLPGASVYRVAFDPADLDHIVLGSVTDGAWASFDGGATWQRARGLSASGGPVNVFNLVVSPVRSGVVWAMGLDIDELDAGAPSGGRHLYASTDGGLSYQPVVDQDARVTLINGPLLVPHPTDAGVLYFVFGTSYASYGTDLYRYDASSQAVTLTHSDHDEIGAIAFHPASPQLMYLGLVSEQIGLAGEGKPARR